MIGHFACRLTFAQDSKFKIDVKCGTPPRVVANIDPQFAQHRVVAESHSNLRSNELERVRRMTGISLQQLWLKVEWSSYGCKKKKLGKMFNFIKI